MKHVRATKSVDATAEQPLRVVVSYTRKFPGLWRDVSECVYASVESYRHENDWLADCHMSLPNEGREQWNTVRRFPTRDAAAAYAAAFVIEAERMVEAVQLGENVFMPHRAMKWACRRALEADSNLKEIATSNDRRKIESARLDFEVAWYRAHDFRDFTESLVAA